MKEENQWPHITQTQALKKAFGEFSFPHWLNPSPIPSFPFCRSDWASTLNLSQTTKTSLPLN